MLKLFLWLRYLSRKKLVSLSIAAVGLSTALLIVVASLFSSFIDAFEQSAVDIMGDVIIGLPVKCPKYPLLLEQLEQLPAVHSATASLSAQGMLFLGKGNIKAVSVLGIDPVGRAEVTGFGKSLVRRGNDPKPPVFDTADDKSQTAGFVGIGVITKPDEKTDEYDYDIVNGMIGKRVVLITATATAGSQTKKFKRRNLPFVITDVVFTGVYELDKSYIYLPIQKLQQLLYPDEKDSFATQIQIKLSDPVSHDSAIAQIRGLWRNFATDEIDWSPYLINQTDITTSKEMQSRLIAEFHKQMDILLLIFGIISCSVILLILCILYMIVETKLKDIAIIKSCGAGQLSTASIFLGLGACIGSAGSALGILLGYTVVKNINTIEGWIRVLFGLKLWKSSVYMFSKIPNQMAWETVLPIVLWSIAAAIVGALIPAIVAVRTKPVDILRYE